MINDFDFGSFRSLKIVSYQNDFLHIDFDLPGNFSRQQPAVDAPEKQICGEQPAAGIEPQSSRMGRGRYKKVAGDAAADDEPGGSDIADVVRQNVLKIL
jgi:hypothetical protein